MRRVADIDGCGFRIFEEFFEVIGATLVPEEEWERTSWCLVRPLAEFGLYATKAMSRSSRKKAQREAYARAMREQRQAMWKPDLPKEELRHFHDTCDRMFAALEAVSRPAAVATRPAHDQPMPKSHAGGSMLMAPTDEWPTENGQPLSAALEIHLDELPTKPSPLNKSPQ